MAAALTWARFLAAADDDAELVDGDSNLVMRMPQALHREPPSRLLRHCVVSVREHISQRRSPGGTRETKRPRLPRGLDAFESFIDDDRRDPKAAGWGMLGVRPAGRLVGGRAGVWTSGLLGDFGQTKTRCSSG